MAFICPAQNKKRYSKVEHADKTACKMEGNARVYQCFHCKGYHILNLKKRNKKQKQKQKARKAKLVQWYKDTLNEWRVNNL